MIKITRRNNWAFMVKAELLINEATGAIETMGADVRLTNAQIKLSEALELVANYVDEQIEE